MAQIFESRTGVRTRQKTLNTCRTPRYVDWLANFIDTVLFSNTISKTKYTFKHIRL
jgi:hypothetical protein